MSLTIALQNALSGLSTSQSALQVISNNIVNVNTEGYSRKIAVPLSRALEGRGAGVELSDISRVVDERLLHDMRINLSSLGTARILDSFYSRIQDQFGTPASNSSISGTLTNLSTAMQALAATPESSTLQSQTIRTAIAVTKQLNSMTAEVQALRLEADREITTKIQFINGQLDIIADLNVKIERELAVGQPTSELEDIRDQALNGLSNLIEFSQFKRATGEIVVLLSNGAILADKNANPLSHTPAGAIAPHISYPGSGINGILHNGKDITTAITGGELKGLIEARDQILPDLQAEIDRLTQVLRDELNAVHNAGTGLPPADTLTGTRTFANPTADTISITANVRIAVVDQQGDFVSYFDLAAGSYTISDVMGQISLGLGTFAKATVSANGPLAISATAATNGIAIVDLGTQTVTHTDGATTFSGFSNYFGLNDLFVTPGNVQGDSNAGISTLIKVRDDIVSTPSRLSRGALDSNTTAPLPAAGESAVGSGDNSIIQQLADKFLEDLTFAAAGGLTLIPTTLAGYGAEVLSANSVAAAVVQNDLAFRDTLSQEIAFRSQSISGVNLDEEMSNLILYQNTYTATARIITIIQDLFDVLQGILR